MTFCFSSVSEEAIEDVEGPSEAAADPEELAKDQEGGGEKEQSKWTGSVCAAFRPLTSVSPGGGRLPGQGADASFICPESLCWLCAVRGGFGFCFLQWSASFSFCSVILKSF